MNSIKLLPCLAMSVLVLAACGGGSSGASATPDVPTPPPTITVSSLKEVSVPSAFGWSTTQTAPSVAVTLSRASGSALGDARIVISNFIDKDPTGSGESIVPMSTDVLASALVGNASGPNADAAFGAINFPAGASSVLVEAFSLADGSKLAWQLVTITRFSAGAVTISF